MRWRKLYRITITINSEDVAFATFFIFFSNNRKNSSYIYTVYNCELPLLWESLKLNNEEKGGESRKGREAYGKF